MNAQSLLEDGRWHADLQLNDSTNLGFTIVTKGGEVSIENAAEKITLTDIRFSNDSIFARFPYYDAELRFVNLGEILSGEYINLAKTSNNIYYFRALKNFNYRFFQNPAPPKINLSGRWQLVFDNEEGIDRSNVAVFTQTGNRVTGSVLTVTGDHRYLDGEISGDQVTVSTFNGVFIMRYSAQVQADGSLRGTFYSGKTGFDTWTAYRNDSASLPDPNSLTYIKERSQKFDFAFPDASGKIWTMKDPFLKNNVVVVQLMGTWCPNCLDESAYLNEWLQRNSALGVRVIAIDFERTTDSVKVWNSINRFQQRMQIEYPVVFGGSSNRDSASAKLPMISKILAYPTSLIIDKKGDVRKIHTGFSGPATGDDFTAYKKEFEAFVNELLAE
jgi:thiol-disulfide isomerase/thioredoxin